MMKIYLKIAEPRAIRVAQFGVYICMLAAGIAILINTPQRFEGAIGVVMVYVLGCFITFGALAGAVSVLPGIWWLERVGIIALVTGLSIYAVILAALGAAPLTVIVGVAFMFTFIQRWLEIRRFQVAPKIAV